MAVKNHLIHNLRITQEMDKLLNEIASELDFKKTDLIRLLLNNSLKRLRFDINKYGISNLEFKLDKL